MITSIAHKAHAIVSYTSEVIANSSTLHTAKHALIQIIYIYNYVSFYYVRIYLRSYISSYGESVNACSMMMAHIRSRNTAVYNVCTV